MTEKLKFVNHKIKDSSGPKSNYKSSLGGVWMSLFSQLFLNVHGFLGISLQLLDSSSSQAEAVYKRALSLAKPEEAHTIFCNLGNLYRQQKQYESAKAMFTKSLDLQPGYAPAYNNLGLVFVAERRWEEAKFCFNKAIQVDPLLDAAKSNMIKAAAMCREHAPIVN